jgi:putative acetyltransferase
MHAMIGAADALGEPLIALLGDTDYYSQFGFVPSTDLGVVPPEQGWGPHFQVLRLNAWNDSITGSFRYSAPFDQVS